MWRPITSSPRVGTRGRSAVPGHSGRDHPHDPCRPARSHRPATPYPGPGATHPGRAAHGRFHAGRRLLRAERGAARGRRRPRVLPRRPAVDRDRLLAVRRRFHPLVRPDRRPVRTAPAVPRGHRPAGRLLTRRRAGHHAVDADRRPGGTGSGHRRSDARGAFPADHLVPRGAGACQGARSQRGADGGGVHHRRRPRRRAHGPAELAVGILRQRPRRRGRAGGRTCGAHGEPTGPPSLAGRAGRRHRHPGPARGGVRADPGR